MNIFETIENVTSRTEPYHSRFLADALNHSLKGDRSLFDAIWKLAVPQDWAIPDYAIVTAEKDLKDGRRIDIFIRCDSPQQCVVGIEVKTVEASADIAQLQKYLDDLKNNYSGYSIHIVYLTPFNRDRAGDVADRLQTVHVFEQFAQVFPDARHLSWLDLAEIPWDGNAVWRQHQEYVCKEISKPSKLKNPVLNRDLAYFFGGEAAERFRDRLSDLEIKLGEGDTEINLSEFKDVPLFATKLVNAFVILLDASEVSRNANKADRFPDKLRRPFLDSQFHEVHAALFSLSERFRYVWVEGESNYGVRTAYKNRSRGVSLVRSVGQDRLLVRQRR